MNKAAFLDRDGTLVRAFLENETTRGPRRMEEVELLPGAFYGCQELAMRGYRLVMVTNQPDVSRGIVSRISADWINQHIAEKLHLHSWLACYHDNRDRCCCRKPKPGMLFHAAVQMELCLDDCVMFGDTIADSLAAKDAGVTFVKLETNGSLMEAIKCL